jgi:hypothetical protein
MVKSEVSLVTIDCCRSEFDCNYYSVPDPPTRPKVEIRATITAPEIIR